MLIINIIIFLILNTSRATESPSSYVTTSISKKLVASFRVQNPWFVPTTSLPRTNRKKTPITNTGPHQLSVSQAHINTENIIQKPLYKITRLNTAGIMFENFANTYMYNNNYILLTSVKLTQFNEEMHFIENLELAINNLSHIKQPEVCEALQKRFDKELCSSYVIQKQRTSMLRNIISLIKHTNQVLKQETYSEKRKKRESALFTLRNALGSSIRWFTGLTGHDEEEQLLYRLNHIEGTQDSLNKIIEKQIDVTKSVYNVISMSNQQTTKERQQLLNKIMEESEKINELKNTIFNLQIQQKISNLMDLMLLELETVNKEQELLLNIILSTQNNNLHPMVIRANEILSGYRKRVEKLGIIQTITDYQTLKQIMNVESIIAENNLLIKIIIPIPNPTMYQMNQIYILPIPIKKGLVSTLDIEDRYVAANFSLQKFITMNTFDFSVCKKLRSRDHQETLICPMNKPSNTDTSYNCLLGLLAGTVNGNSICSHRVSRSKKFITKLHKANTWIVSPTDPQRIQIICPGISPKRLLISKLVTIQIASNCQFSTDNLIFHADNSETQKMELFQPDTILVPPPQWDPAIEFNISLPKHNQAQTIIIQDPLSHNEHWKEGTKTIMELEKDWA